MSFIKRKPYSLTIYLQTVPLNTSTKFACLKNYYNPVRSLVVVEPLSRIPLGPAYDLPLLKTRLPVTQTLHNFLFELLHHWFRFNLDRNLHIFLFLIGQLQIHEFPTTTHVTLTRTDLPTSTFL
jgi:hypothetical protein